MIVRGHQGGHHAWQLILADLALILFLITLTGLVSSNAGEDEPRNADAYLAPSQALFRPTSRGPSLPEWLEEQPIDPRMTLTIIAEHNDEDQQLMWQNAQIMAASAAGSPVKVRVVIREAAQSDLYASLGFDQPELPE